MRFRWTIQELNEVSDHRLLETLITERQSSCTNCYAPLYRRLSQLHANHDKLRPGVYAAAPDLLEACKVAMIVLEDTGPIEAYVKVRDAVIDAVGLKAAIDELLAAESE